MTLSAALMVFTTLAEPGAVNAQIGLTTTALDGGGVQYTVTDPNATVSAQLDFVTSIPSPFSGPTVNSLIGADTFYTAGFTGTSAQIANIEAGSIWNGHQDLGHVTSFTYDASAGGQIGEFDRHATWVGQSIGGRPYGTGYREGIAPNATLKSGAIATVWIGSPYTGSFNGTYNSFFYPYTSPVSGFGAVDVINSSWGFTDAAGVDSITVGYDGLAFANPRTTFVVSAGNSGSGANTVGGPGSGYNAITVGALQNNGANVYNSVASFSSRGPQDYYDPVHGTIAGVRAPVDITAPGTDLTLAFYGGTTGGNTGGTAAPGSTLYSAGLAGTSFSAPTTAGGVGLMVDAARSMSLPADALDARVIKANLLNAANRIPGWNNGEIAHPNGNGGVKTTQSLDYTSGAGALDLNRTYDQYLTGATDLPGTTGGTTSQVIGWDFAQVNLGFQTDLVINTPLQAGTDFRATLAWFRDRAYVNPTTATDIGFANLDLQIWDSTFTTLYSESSSLYNPVELLDFTLPQTTAYGIRVAYVSNLFGSMTQENFGLAWWGTAAVPAGVPEPAVFSLFLVGILCVRFYRRRV